MRTKIDPNQALAVIDGVTHNYKATWDKQDGVVRWEYAAHDDLAKRLGDTRRAYEKAALAKKES